MFNRIVPASLTTLIALCLASSVSGQLAVPDFHRCWAGRTFKCLIPIIEFRFDDIPIGLSVPDDPSEEAPRDGSSRRQTERHFFDPHLATHLAAVSDDRPLTMAVVTAKLDDGRPTVPKRWGGTLEAKNARTFRMAATPEVLSTDRAAGRYVFLLESRSVKGERFHHYAVFQLGGAAPLTIDWFVDWHAVQRAYAGRSDRIGRDGATSARWEVRPAEDGRLWPVTEAKGYRLRPEYR